MIDDKWWEISIAPTRLLQHKAIWVKRQSFWKEIIKSGMNMEVGEQGVKIKWEKLKTPFLLMAVRATDALSCGYGSNLWVCVIFLCGVLTCFGLCVAVTNYYKKGTEAKVGRGCVGGGICFSGIWVRREGLGQQTDVPPLPPHTQCTSVWHACLANRTAVVHAWKRGVGGAA